jgi:hypothetical protein
VAYEAICAAHAAVDKGSDDHSALPENIGSAQQVPEPLRSRFAILLEELRDFALEET